MRLIHALSLIGLTAGVALARTDSAPTSRALEVLFVVLTDDARPSTLSKDHYEQVLTRTTTVIERGSLGRLRVHATTLVMPAHELGDSEVRYDARNFEGWFRALRSRTATRTYDALAFAPDRTVAWCTDAHSLGVVIDGVRFTCLEPTPNVALSSNVLVHKLFHTFGFFHQGLRNKQERLLAWEIGLPSTTRFSDMDDRADIAFFEPTALQALGILPSDGTGCDLGVPLHCAQPGEQPFECRDVVGPFCRDVDRDGIVDAADGYPLTPHAGVDSDHDGIPDDLDLCPDDEVNVSGARGGPMNYWSDDGNVTLDIRPSEETRWVDVSSAIDKPLGDVLTFPEDREQAVAGGRVELVTRASIVRVQAVHPYRGHHVVRTFYLYTRRDRTSPGPWAYFDEREWFYFNRFGCDVPESVDLFDARSFDADADGLPNAALVNVPDAYDWDGDGVPDVRDTLPTVSGRCSDAHARGVKDSDGDGLCDPGKLVYDALPATVRRGTYFGELPLSIDSDPDADDCPYFAGPRASRGCPSPGR